MGGGKISVPGPSPQEEALQREQLGILREQKKLSDLLTPFLLEQQGVKTIRDDAGNITGFEKDDPNAELRQQIETGLLERSQSALAGELPVAPGLTRDRTEGRQTLEESLRKQLGSGFETSSPGIEALGNFDARSDQLFEGARRGDLSLSESLSLGRQESEQRTLNNFLGGAAGASQLGLASVPGRQAALGGFRQDRFAQLGANQQSAQNRAGNLQSLFGAVGTGVGLGLGRKFG